MWEMLPSLEVIVQGCSLAFTEPTLASYRQVLLGWIMCLGMRTEYRVFDAIHPEEEVSRKERHPFGRFYNFFIRAKWDVSILAHAVTLMIVTALNPAGRLYLLVDDTLLHKRGKKVYGLGWFRDAVASTKKQVATASGNNWACWASRFRYRCAPIRSCICPCWRACICRARDSRVARSWRVKC
jgi:hypothetical protein